MEQLSAILQERRFLSLHSLFITEEMICQNLFFHTGAKKVKHRSQHSSRVQRPKTRLHYVVHEADHSERGRSSLSNFCVPKKVFEHFLSENSINVLVWLLFYLQERMSTCEHRKIVIALREATTDKVQLRSHQKKKKGDERKVRQGRTRSYLRF